METQPNSSIDFLSFALRYAQNGWRVFPIKPGWKSAPLIKDWPKLATTDQDQIREWWTKWHDANIAIATGAGSGIIVIDIDKRDGGFTNLVALQRQNGPFPTNTATQQTGSGGEHYVFVYPESVEQAIKNSAGELAPGIDVRADGGYIVAAPSFVKFDKDGNEIKGDRLAYKWTKSFDDVAPLPPWLLPLLLGRAKVDAQTTTVDHSNEGRNAQLIREAGVLRRRGLSQSTIYSCLRSINQEWYAGHVKGLLPDNELQKIAQSAGRYEPKPDASEGPLVIDNAAELWARDIAPMHWLVKDIIPSDGVSMLTDRPKKGKSFLALQAAVAVAGGTLFLKRFPTEQGRVLYYALEDSPRRIKSRQALVPGSTVKDLDFTYALSLSPDGITKLRCILDEATEAQRPYRLVVIDTFLNACQQRKGNADPVRADYNEIKVLREVCQAHGCGILLVHHSRKAMRGDNEVSLDSILGTTGVTASVDSIIILATTGEGDRVMHVTGKDCTLDDDQAMKFDPKQTPPWSCEGSAFWLTVGVARMEIIEMLETGPKKEGDLVTALGKKKNAVSNMMRRMAEACLVERAADGRAWQLAPGVQEALDKNKSIDIEELENVVGEVRAERMDHVMKLDGSEFELLQEVA